MLETIHLIQHSHTDLGFTHDQPIVESLHGRFLRQALDNCERFADAPSGERFRWTVETCGWLEAWLERQPSALVTRFQRLERAGLIEVCALPDHTTPLADTADLHASLAPAARLRRDYGLRIDSAMNCDVNGQNWPFADALLDAGVRGYTTAINTHFGRSPLTRPLAFRWRAPSGRLLPVFHGPAYGYPGKLGIAPGADLAVFRDEWLPRLEHHLAATRYAAPVLLLQSIHPFGDNGPSDPDLLEFITRWNAADLRPRLRLSTPREWWSALAPYLAHLPVHGGDWTDSWIFGAGSAAREVAYVRATRPRLRAGGLALAAARALARPDDDNLPATEDAWSPAAPAPGDAPPPVGLAPAAPGGFVGAPASRIPPTDPTDLGEAIRALATAQTLQLRYLEHTWTADCACEHPHGDDAFTQSAHKRALAATARSLGTLALRDGLATLARHVARGAPDDLLLFNPLPFPRVLTGLVGGSHAYPRGRRDDPTSGRHSQDRKLDYPLLELADRPANEWRQNPEFWLRPTEVPALGYAVVPRAEACVDPFANITDSAEPVVETPLYRLRFDLERGGLRSLVCRVHGDRELTDPAAPYPLNGYLHERVGPPLGGDASAPPRRALFAMDWHAPGLEPPSGWRPDHATERTGPARVLSHRVRRSPLGVLVVQRLAAPGLAGELEQLVWLPAHADWIEFTSRLHLPCETYPQANYLAFPFALPPGARARHDIGGLALRPGLDQLPGVACDYFCAQNWIDLGAEDFGVTVAAPENPLFMLGGLHFARAVERHPEDAPPHLFAWLTNNYWETNYPVAQPGPLTSRHRLRPRSGPFDEAAAHAFGLDAAHTQPCLQHLGERPAPGPALPAQGSLFTLSTPDHAPGSFILLACEPIGEADSLLRLQNATDEPLAVLLQPGLLALDSVAALSPEPVLTPLVECDGVRLNLPPRRVAAWQVAWRRPAPVSAPVESLLSATSS